MLDEGLPEGHSGGPLLREGLVVGLVSATEGDFAYAIPALFVGHILESWKVPFQIQTTRRSSSSGARDQEPEPPPTGGRSPDSTSRRVPEPLGQAGCFGVVTSSTGSGQPVRAAALPSAPALLSLPAGTRVPVKASLASSGYRWYQIEFDTTNGRQSGWMQADHLQLSDRCKE